MRPLASRNDVGPFKGRLSWCAGAMGFVIVIAACTDESADGADASSSMVDSSEAEVRRDAPGSVVDSATDGQVKDASRADSANDAVGQRDSADERVVDGPNFYGDHDRTPPDGRPPPRDSAAASDDVRSVSSPDANTDGQVSVAEAGGVDSAIRDARPVNPDAPPPTTLSIFAERSAACLHCATDNGCFDPAQQGYACEAIDPMFYKASDIVQATGETEVAMCLRLVQKSFDTGCADTGQQTPCLCGATEPGKCLAGSAKPTGALYQDYIDGFGSAETSQILSNFTVPAFGAGRANGLVGCVSAFECGACFGRDASAPYGGSSNQDAATD